MSPNHSESDLKFEKRTELLWKGWWFAFFLCVAPILTGIVSYYIFRAIIATYFTSSQYIIDVYPIAFAIIAAMFSLLFFYKAFDKYRKNPFFTNEKNNLSARIHIIFLISLSSMLITPIFIYSTPEQYSFELLPLISFIILYNIIWYYYYYQPIDIFHVNERKFTHIRNIRLAILRPHNFIIIINYIVQITFLSLTFYTGLSWLFGIIVNTVMYILTLLLTKSLRRKISKGIERDEMITVDLGKFQKRFVEMIYNVIFSFILLIPIIFLIFPLLNDDLLISDYFRIQFFLTSLFLIYLKGRIYITIYFQPYIKQLRKILKMEIDSERYNKKIESFQNTNMKLSFMLVGSILIFSLLLNNPIISLVALPVFALFTQYEKRKSYLNEKDLKLIQIINSIGILTVISFGLLSFLPWNVQAFIFLISLYFLLEIFVRVDYLKKESAIVIQNIIAIFSFYLLIYFFYPVIFLQYTSFTSDPTLVLISDIMINAILVSIVILISLYRLYGRFFREKYNFTFKIAIIATLLTIQLLIFILILLRSYFLFKTPYFISILIFSLNIFPIVFGAFLFINYKIGIIQKESYKHYSFYNYWIMLIIFFMSLTYFNIVLILLTSALFMTFLYLQLIINLGISFSAYLLFKYGKTINKIAAESYEKLLTVNGWIFTLDLFFLIYSGASILGFEVLFSLLCSLLIITIIINLLCSQEIFFTSAIKSKMNIITLFYISFIIGIYSFQISTLFVNVLVTTIIITIIFTSISLLFPLYYLKKREIWRKLVFNLIKIDILMLAISVSLIPTIIGLELFYLSQIKDFVIFIFNIINFSLLIQWVLFSLSFWVGKKYQLKEKYQTLSLQIVSFIEVGLTFTVAFFYPFYLLQGTSYFIIPIITATIFFYLPSVYSYTKDLFPKDFLKRLIIMNTLILWGCLIFIPINIGLDLVRLGIEVDFLFLFIFVVLLFYLFVRFLFLTCEKLELKPKFLIQIKILHIFVWFILSLVILVDLTTLLPAIEPSSIPFCISLFVLIFFVLNLVNIYQIRGFIRNIYRDGVKNDAFKKFGAMFLKFNDFILEGLTITISSVIAFAFNPLLLLYYGITDLVYYLWIGSIFFGSILVLFYFLGRLTDISPTDFSLLKAVCWILFKVCSSILVGFYIPFSLFNKIMLVILIISILMPITFDFIERLQKIPEKTENLMRISSVFVSLITLIGFYIEIYFTITTQYIYFIDNIFLWSLLLILKLIVLCIFFLKSYNKFIIGQMSPNFTRFYLSIYFMFVLLVYFSPVLILILFPVSTFFFLYYRQRTIFQRYLIYTILSIVFYLEILSFIGIFSLLSEIEVVSSYFYVLIFLASYMAVLLLSIVSNQQKSNILENFSLYSLMSVWTFFFILGFTNVLILYNITISLFVFLLFSGIFFKYSLKDGRYKWFIRPCILLFVFDLVSWFSYSFFFILPQFSIFNPYLTFTLTLSCSALAIVFLYNKSPQNLRTTLFLPALGAIIGGIPSIILLLFLTYIPIQLEFIFLFLIAGNIAVFLYYLSIGIYNWEFSREIWEKGWWIWNFLPILNFLIIYESLTGIDIYTNSLDIFGLTEISGSMILTILICSLMYVPVLYSKIKEFFYKILLVVWGESLFIVLWISQNLFGDNILLISISLAFFGALLLMPLLYKLTKWRIVSIFWLLTGILNIFFLMVLFLSIELILSIAISINIIVGGFFLLVYSYFPNIHRQKPIMASGYSVIIGGQYFLIYFTFVVLTQNFYIPLNLAFLTVAASLYTSKYLKLNYKYLYTAIYWIIIINTSWLCFNTLILIEGFELVAICSFFMIFGALSYIFNRFRFRNPVRAWIPYLILGIGSSTTLIAFLQLFLPTSYLLLTGIFIGSFSIFLYFLLKQFDHAYVLWFIIPISFTCITLEALLLFEIFVPIAFLSWMILYLAFLQVIINLAANYGFNSREEHKYKGLWRIFEKDEIYKAINLTCFILNSTYLSIFITYLTPITEMFQIIQFLIIWSFLILLSMKYFKSSEIEKIVSVNPEFISFVNIFFYFLLGISSSILILIFLLTYDFMLITIIFYFLFILFGILFVEFLVLEKPVLKLLPEDLSNKLIFMVWGAFQIILAGFLIFTYMEMEFINLFSITSIMIIETVLSVILIYFLGIVYPKDEDFKRMREKGIPYLANLLYIEGIICLFGFFTLFIGVLESMLISLGVLVGLTLVEISKEKREKNIFIYVIHVSCFILASILLFVFLLQFVVSSPLLFSLIILMLISLQFYSNYRICEIITFSNLEEKERVLSIRENVQSLIGIIVYINLSFILYLVLDLFSLEIMTIVLLLSLFIHGSMYADELYFKFLKKGNALVKFISWISILIFSFSYLFYFFSLIIVIPLIIIILIAEIYYLLFLLEKNFQTERSLLKSAKSYMIFFLYLDLSTWPLYFLIATSELISIVLNLSLVLSSVGIIFTISLVDKNLKVFSEKIRIVLQNASFMVIGVLISIIIFIPLELIAFPNLMLNVSLLLLINLIFLAFVIKPFKEHSLLSLCYWNAVFILSSLIIFSLSNSLPLSIFIFCISGLLYLYLFLLEELREFFSKLVGFFVEKFSILKTWIARIVNAVKEKIFSIYRRIRAFIKRNFKQIWLGITITVSIIVMIVGLVLLFLPWYISLILTISVFFLFYSEISGENVETKEREFRKRMMRLIFGWLAVIGILLYFIEPVFYTILFFVGLLVLGAIILPYVYYKEKNEEISIKWRFYTTLFFIIILIIAGIIVYLQFF